MMTQCSQKVSVIAAREREVFDSDLSSAMKSE